MPFLTQTDVFSGKPLWLSVAGEGLETDRQTDREVFVCGLNAEEALGRLVVFLGDTAAAHPRLHDLWTHAALALLSRRFAALSHASFFFIHLPSPIEAVAAPRRMKASKHACMHSVRFV